MSTLIEPWDEGVVFLKHTDTNDYVYYTEHRCWNAGRFVEMCVKAEGDVGTSVERVTQHDFRKATVRRRG